MQPKLTDNIVNYFDVITKNYSFKRILLYK